MAPEPDPPTREESTVDLATSAAGRAMVAAVPVETCRGMAPEPAE